MARLPPLDGCLHLPDFVDYHLKHNPTRPAYVFVQDEAHRVQITFEQLARAVHRASYILRPDPQHDGKNGEPVAIIATADALLYHTVVLACVRAGLVVSIYTCFYGIWILLIKIRHDSRFSFHHEIH